MSLALHWKSAAALLFFVAWFAFNWFSTAHKILQYYNPLPVWDYWRVVEDLQGFKSFDLSVFWRQHNEHRIVFPEIIFAIDMLWLGGRQALPTVLNACCYFGIWMILAGAALKQRSVSRFSRILAVVLAGIVMGWPLNAFVLGSPFLLQWTLVQLAAVLGLALLGRAKSAAKPWWLAGVICCGVIATFSSANGMLLWPVLIGAGLLFRMAKGRMAALVIAAVVSVFVFFIGYRSPGHLDALALVEHPVHCLGFIVSYVSMPFGVLRAPWVGFVFGSISVLGWVGLAIQARRRDVFLSPVGRSLFFGYYAFVLLTALSTAAGRMDLQDAGFDAAKAGRYVTLPLVGWAALFEAAILVFARDRQRIFSLRVTGAIAMVVLLFMQVRLARWLRSEDRFNASEQLTALSIENGILDASLLSSIFPHPSFVQRYLPELKDNHLSIYSDRLAALPGQPVHALFPLMSGETSSGKVLRVVPVQGGVEVVVATNHDEAARRANVLLFVDEHERIAGFGRRATTILSGVLSLHPEKAATDWVGFVRFDREGRRFSMLLADTRRCRVTPVAGALSISGP